MGSPVIDHDARMVRDHTEGWRFCEAAPVNDDVVISVLDHGPSRRRRKAVSCDLLIVEGGG